jgi:hypothetical protein
MKRLTVSLLEYDPTKGQSILLIIDFSDASNDLIDVHSQASHLPQSQAQDERNIVSCVWLRQQHGIDE